MKFIFLLAVLALLSCNDNDGASIDKENDSTAVRKPRRDSIVSDPVPEQKKQDTIAKTYSNTRFREVTVERLSETKFRISGKGQIFEANFGWVIEDGHNELKEGFVMTDAGAPEWGNFDFTVEAKKARPNSTLHIILFETSMKDGSRQHELPIRLY